MLFVFQNHQPVHPSQYPCVEGVVTGISAMRNWRLWGAKWLKVHLLSPGCYYRPHHVDCPGRTAEAWEGPGDMMALWQGNMGINQDTIKETQTWSSVPSALSRSLKGLCDVSGMCGFLTDWFFLWIILHSCSFMTERAWGLMARSHGMLAIVPRWRGSCPCSSNEKKVKERAWDPASWGQSWGFNQDRYFSSLL